MTTAVPIPQGYGQPGDTYDSGKAEPSTAFPAQATVAQAGPEDSTSFEHTDIAINILLLRQDGHPDGRLVSIVTHNFAGLFTSQEYRASELTQESLLDNVQKGINAVVQQFLWKQADERQKKLALEAKVKPPLVVPPLQATPTRSVTPAEVSPQADTTTPATPPAASETVVSAPTKNAASKPTKATSKHVQFSMF
jgi:hypothetical protein